MNVGETNLKLLVMEAQITCVLEKEHIHLKYRKKNYFKGKKRKSYYSMLQYDSVKNFMNVCSSFALVRGRQVVIFPNRLLVII